MKSPEIQFFFNFQALKSPEIVDIVGLIFLLHFRPMSSLRSLKMQCLYLVISIVIVRNQR